MQDWQLTLTLRNWRFCQVQSHMTQKLGQLDGKYCERLQLPVKAKSEGFSSPTLGNTCYTYYQKYKM